MRAGTLKTVALGIVVGNAAFLVLHFISLGSPTQGTSPNPPGVDIFNIIFGGSLVGALGGFLWASSASSGPQRRVAGYISAWLGLCLTVVPFLFIATALYELMRGSTMMLRPPKHPGLVLLENVPLFCCGLLLDRWALQLLGADALRKFGGLLFEEFGGLIYAWQARPLNRYVLRTDSTVEETMVRIRAQASPISGNVWRNLRTAFSDQPLVIREGGDGQFSLWAKGISTPCHFQTKLMSSFDGTRLEGQTCVEPVFRVWMAITLLMMGLVMITSASSLASRLLGKGLQPFTQNDAIGMLVLVGFCAMIWWFLRVHQWKANRMESKIVELLRAELDADVIERTPVPRFFLF